MGEIVNPYIAGAPVTEQRMFFGREDIFQWIENSIAGQYADHILVVHGQRRVGKTSVLKQLGNRLPKRYIPVFFDLQGRTHTTLDHFLWWLARETVRVLKQNCDIELPPPDKKAFAADPEFFENQFLTGLRPHLGNNTLLLTFDEFDNLEENEVKDELGRPLIDHLRRLMGQPNLNFIFSIGSSGRKLENMQAAYTDFFKTALYKKISFLSEEQTHHLITRPVEGVLKYEQAAVERIYSVTSGHPYFTQLTCHELFSRCQRTEQRRIAKADVEAILDDVVERGTVNLKFVWDEASDIEKWSLAALAQLDKTDNHAVTDYLRKNRVRFSESDLTSGLLHLREKDVITSNNRFVIHLLQIWLQKNRPIEQAREELTEANPIASRFIEIGLEFRDGGQYEKAIEFFRQALSVSADNLQAQVNIAITFATQGQLEQAIIEFEKALTIDDEDVASRSGLCDAHLALGDTAMKRGRPKDAVLSYQRVLAINAEHLEARGRMSEISRQRAEKALTDGMDEEALSAFAEALKFTPDDQSLIERMEKVRAEKKAKVLAALLARSEKEANTKSWEKSIATLNEALEVAPQDKSILAKIASVKAKQLKERLDSILVKAEQAEKAGRWDAAISALGEYLALKPDDTAIQKRLDNLRAAKRSAWLSAVHARADAAVASERWDEAIAALNEVFSLEPGNAEIAGKMEQVRAAQKAAELKAILRRAEQAALGGRWDEAVTALNAGLAAEPENETLKTKLAEARKAKREAHLQAALRLADSAAQAGKWEAAVASLNEVLANEPDNIEFQQKLAEVRTREHQSQWQAARTQSEGLREAERFAEALQIWQDYLSIHPEDREQVDKETKPIAQERELFDLYTSASESMAARDFDPAIRSLKEIILRDENYKDASRLLTKAIESRRTGTTQRLGKSRTKPASPKPVRAPKTGGKRMWVIGGLAAILILGIGGGLFWLGKNGLFAAPAPTSAGTRTAPTVTPTPTLDPKLQAALAAIQNEEPLYQTSFDDWDSNDTGRNAALVNGKLILTSDDENGAHLELSAYPSDSYAVEFELSISGDSSPDGHCVYEAGNGAPYGDESNRVFSAEFHPGEDLAALSSYVHQLRGHERMVTASFDKTKSNVVRLVVLGDRITAFINGQLAYTALDPAGSAVYLYHGLSAYNQVTCGFDHFKYWDLREMDSAVKTALATIQSEEPLYQTSFDTWDFGDPQGDAKVENGKLIVTSENQQHAGVDLYNLISDKYAVQFDLRALDISPEGHCIFETSNSADSNTSSWRAMSASFHSDGHAILAHYIHPDRFDIFKGASGEYDLANSNAVTLIVLGDQIAAFIDGNLVYTAMDPDGSAVYAYQALSANYTAQCEYDNFKIWDLRGLDPATLTALAAIQNEEPLYQTSFDTWDFGNPVENAKVENGKLVITGGLGESTYVPLDRSSFSSDRFAVEFKQQILEPSQGAACYFNIGGNNERSLRAAFPLSGMSRIDRPVVSGVGNDLIIGSIKIDPSYSNTVTIIVLNDQISVFVNGQLAFTALDPEGSAVYKNVNFEADFQMTCEFDNYKFWDLSGVDFSAATTTTGPTSSFASILDSIAGKTPDYEDDFSNLSSGWSTQSDAIGETGYQDGAYFISTKDDCYGANLPTNQVFSDFVLEMDVGFINQGNGTVSILFRDNGTAHYGANISSSGWVGFHKNVNGVHIPLLETEIPKLSFQSWDTPKRLTLIARQDRVAIYVNGELIIAQADTSSSQGRFNFAVCNGSPLQALIDNLKIWDITNLSP
jgi:tetratricopeptide (TPR) repeat protein